MARRLLLCAPALLFLLVFFVGPLVVNLAKSTDGPGGALASYGRALGDAYYLGVIARTLALAAAVTLGTLLIGYPIALAIARSSGGLKTALIFLVVTPLLINVVVRTFGWMVVLGRSGLMNAALKSLGLGVIDIANSWISIWIALVHVLLPFMVLSVASALEGINPSLEESAAALGATRWRILTHITVPLSREGIVTGAVLVFALGMGSFVTVLLMGNNATMVLPLLVYQQLTVASDWPFAAALGNILLGVVLVATFLQLRLAARLRP